MFSGGLMVAEGRNYKAWCWWPFIADTAGSSVQRRGRRCECTRPEWLGICAGGLERQGVADKQGPLAGGKRDDKGLACGAVL
jgi:hypothetical protein